MRALIVVGVSLVVLIVVVGMGVMGWYNTGVSLQETTLAQARDNMNRYDAMWKKIVETAQVPDKYKEDFQGLLQTETSAKFGKTGSKALMQWFQERDLRPPAEIYVQVQRVIESGRNDFKNGQQLLLDKQKKVREHRKGVWGMFCLMFTDYLEVIEGDLAPPKDTDGDGKFTVLDFDIMTSKKTKKAFEEGEDEEVDVFGKKG